MGKLNNTKHKILEEASILLGEKGYELVSMREISNAVGIKVSSLYNHYKNKQDILDNIINYFSEKLINHQPKIEELDKLLETETPEQILRRFIYIFNDDDKQIMQNMLRILFMEQYHNDNIKNLLFTCLIYTPVNNIITVLDKLIQLDLIPPCDSVNLANMFIKSLVLNAMEYTHDSSSKNVFKEFSDYSDYFINIALARPYKRSDNNLECLRNIKSLNGAEFL